MCIGRDRWCNIFRIFCRRRRGRSESRGGEESRGRAHGGDRARSSKLARIVAAGGGGPIVVPVNSSHHQSADASAMVCALWRRCREDGIIEALEGTCAGSFCAGGAMASGALGRGGRGFTGDFPGAGGSGEEAAGALTPIPFPAEEESTSSGVVTGRCFGLGCGPASGTGGLFS